VAHDSVCEATPTRGDCSCAERRFLVDATPDERAAWDAAARRKPGSVEGENVSGERDYFPVTSARHIRGKVFRYHDRYVDQMLWGINVINTATGERLNSDSPFRTVEEAIEDCNWRVAGVRVAWSIGLAAKSTQRKSRK
jgi:hypothetical protein